MDAIEKPTEPMTPDEFFRWMEETGAERVELLNGFVVEMMSEVGVHARTKHRAANALENALSQTDLKCIVYPDGMTVRSPDDNVFVPDAILQCENIDTSLVEVSDPLIVVEVFSKSTRHIDTGRKLSSYFAIPSVQHYLMIDADKKLVIHYQRGADGNNAVKFVHEGDLRLDPPGLSVPVAAFFDI